MRITSIKSILVFLTIFTMIFSLVACGGNSSAPASQNQPSNNSQPAEQKPTESSNAEASKEDTFDPNDKTGWPKGLRVGGASIGGLMYTYGVGWANLVDDKLGVPTNVEVTGGPNHNIQLMEIGDVELGMTTMGPAWDGWHGEGDWTGGKEHREMRVMFPMYPSVIHWWALKNTGIESMYDFEGKRVGVGPAGGTPGTYLPKFLEILGINATPVNAGFSDLGSQQMDGLIDVLGWAGGIPAGLAMEIEAQHELNWIGFTKEDVDKIIQELPYFSAGIVPAGTYNSQTEDLHALELYNMAIADKDLPDSLIYQIVDTIMNNNDRMMEVHVSSAYTIPKNIVNNTGIYMHPGAIRWFEEQGIELPDGVYPPEYPKKK